MGVRHFGFESISLEVALRVYSWSVLRINRLFTVLLELSYSRVGLSGIRGYILEFSFGNLPIDSDSINIEGLLKLLESKGHKIPNRSAI